MVGSEPNSLIIKHFPAEMTIEQREEFLKLAGAVKVKCMPDEGKMKYTAFATFLCPENARYALTKLHQMEICNRRIVVEYVKDINLKHLPYESDFPRFKEKPSDESGHKPLEKDERKSGMEEFAKSVHGVAPFLGLDYLPSPLLRYRYPVPTPSIIANISHALAAVPKFYTQVLHLMNKMNLPAPFGPVTPTPPLAPDIPMPPDKEPLVENGKIHKDSLQVKEMEVTTSEEESELESDTENQKPSNVAVKRRSQQPKRKKKTPKLQQLFPIPLPSGTAHGQKTEPSEVFDTSSQIDSQKKIHFNIKQTLDSEQKDTVELPKVAEESGFGVMEPKVVDSADISSSEQRVESWDDSNFITLHDLRKKRISEREMKTLSVFKHYDPGEPTFRLYIKNLARQVEEKDLRHIFGRFIDRKSENDRDMFDVRLMKEGRMKGQAFVTLAKEEQAILAVKETNGYILHTKPLVVQYARSAKPKENPQKTKGKS